MEFKHTSVLLHETIDNLNIRPDGIYVDGTLGGAGHSSEIVKRLNENGRLIGIDQDEDAIAAASERLKDYSDKVTIIRSNYCNMKSPFSSWMHCPGKSNFSRYCARLVQSSDTLSSASCTVLPSLFSTNSRLNEPSRWQ